MRYLIMLLIITQAIFSMNLTSSEANEAMKYLRGAKGKGVLLYKNGNFKYLPVHSVVKRKGYIKSFGYDEYSVIHEDSDDYHININGEPVDLAQIYYKASGHKWIRVGSKVKPSSFSYRKNDTSYVYIYKKNEKIPKQKKKTHKKVKVIHSIGNGGATLKITAEDAKYNGANVVLDRQQSF